MAKNGLDLSVFPIIRLDQIGLLSEELLQKATNEVEALIVAGDEKSSKMQEYYVRQLDAMRKETARRKAELRIHDLLSGAKALMDTDYSQFDEPAAPVKPAATSKPNVAVPAPAQTPSPPLNIASSSSVKSLSNPCHHRISVPSQQHIPSVPSGPVILPAIIAVEPIPVISKASSSADLNLPLSDVLSANPSAGSLNTNRSNHSQPRRPQPVVEEPSRKAVEVVNKNFSKEFIVAATGKKKRFYPAKKPSEGDVEEQKMKEKQDRRRQAMDRLMARRQERESIQRAIKEQRRKDQQAKRAAEREARSIQSNIGGEAVISSSDSESVSGGDDGPDLIDDHSTKGDTMDERDEPTAAQLLPSAPVPNQISPSAPKVPVDIVGPVIPSIAVSSSTSSTGVPSGSSQAMPSMAINQSSTHPARIQPSAVSKTKTPVKEVSKSPTKKAVSAPTFTPAAQTMVIEPSLEDTEEDYSAMGDEVGSKSLAALNSIRRLKEMKARNGASSYKAVLSGNLLEEPNVTPSSAGTSVIPPIEEVARQPSRTASRGGSVVAITLGETSCAVAVDVDEDSHSEFTSPIMKEVPAALAECCGNDDVLPLEGGEKTLVQTDTVDTVVTQPHRSILTEGCQIFDIIDDAYIYKYTADQLPGLCAWNLDRVNGQKTLWRTDLDAFRDGILQKDEAAFRQLAKTMRTVPMGLIVLSEECQSILLGQDELLDRKAFVAAWQRYISSFDDKACALSSNNVNVLDKPTSICGNGYRICKKIEYLIKTFFVSAEETLIMDALDSSRRTNDETAEGMQFWLNDNNISMRATSSQRKAPVVVRSRPSSAIVQDVVADAPTEEQALHCDRVLVPSVSSSSSRHGDYKLTDYYPHFGLIFPLAFSQLSGRPESWRLLLESMVQSLKLHEEWLEVMKDYSTVFCTNYELQQNAIPGPVAESSSSRGGRRSASAKTLEPGGSGMMSSASTAKLKASEQVYSGTASSLHYRIKSSRSEVNNILSDSFNTHFANIFTCLPNNLGLGLTWNFLWTWSKPHIKPANYHTLLTWQRLNHFMSGKELTRKDLLKKNIEKYVNHTNKTVSKEFNIMPLTFLLPNEYSQFVQTFTAGEILKKQQQANNTGVGHLNYWILKPVGLSRGRGISLVKDLGDISYHTTCVVQKYLENPLCLYNYKFDLRLYVLVLSFSPLEAYIYQDGFARISTEAFNLDPNNTNNKFIHLTNSSIQKHNHQSTSAYSNIQQQMSKPKSSNEEEEDDEGEVDEGGSKIALQGPHGLWHMLKQMPMPSVNGEASRPIDTDGLWSDICLLVTKSLLIVSDKIPYQPNAFELFGYDVIIDDNMVPWLLEVNASPSLSRDNDLDHKVKNSLIHDIISLLDVLPYNREKLVEILKKRINNKSYMNVASYFKQQGGLAASNSTTGLGGVSDPELEADLRAILGNARPRKYNELPKQMGQFERLAPDEKHFQHVMKLKKKIMKTSE